MSVRQTEMPLIAQPQPQLQLSLTRVSINITTELSHPPPTHPPWIVLVWCSSIYLNESTKITYIIRLLELSKLDLFTTWSKLVYNLLMPCSLLVPDS